MIKPKIKAITFDIWGTILNNTETYNKYHTELSNWIIDKFGFNYYDNMFVENIDKKQFLDDVKILFGTEDVKYVTNLIKKQVKKFKVYSDVKYIFELQKKYKLKIGIISNASFRTHELLKNWKDLKKFDSVVISYEYEFKKPNKLIFETSARKLKIPLKNIIHIGDNYIDDFDGPKKQGINTIILDRNNNYKEIKERITSFKELEKYLKLKK